jgi:hypothetical protein
VRGHDYQGEGRAGGARSPSAGLSERHDVWYDFVVAIYTSCHLFLRGGVVIVD